MSKSKFFQTGRRIIYDYDSLGDSPACLSKEGQSLEGKLAVSQGYGYTEKGEESFCKQQLYLCKKYELDI
jgi:hypothetical protein